MKLRQMKVEQHWCKILRIENSSFILFSSDKLFFISLLQKLIYRQGAIETSDLSQQDKDRIKELLSRENALKYISSEESEEENATPGNGPTPRHVRPLKWERSKLRTIKSVLDATHQARMSKRQKRTAANITRNIGQHLSLRPLPNGCPSWAGRQEAEA